ncbi:ParB/RepB/Spo0J family partition protein [Silvanigrella sp.]|jgi:ParB family chromosome partitioning protein|uniref:ParB/RepB/Spo0J family partition protein n=1 Tax=Silvanigrella sp. TaxID=2024976 RepID=UPI0037C9D0CE
MSTIQSAVNLKHEQIIQRFEKDKLSREQNKYHNIEQYIGKVAFIPTEDIIIEENCRKTIDYDSSEFLQLMASIKSEGILQNLVIEIKKDDDIKLICVSGQRRLLIAKEIGLEKVPCLIKSHTNSSDSLIRSLDENILRKDLPALDLAEAYLSLLNSNMPVEKIAEKYEKNERTVQYYINIARFPEEVKAIIRENPSFFTVRVLLNEFAKKKWLTNEVLLKKIKQKIEPQEINEIKNNVFNDIEEKVLKKIGIQVKLQKGKNENSGKFYLSFKDQDELNRILTLLGI